MSKIVQRAEIAKLAGLLSQSADELAYLESLEVETLIELREQAADMMFDADRDQLARAARAVSKVPVPIVARIAAKRIPPRLAARVAELLPEHRAVKLANRLPGEYLADMAAYADPKRLSHLLAVVPHVVVEQVARCLDERKDFLSMGRVVSHISDVALRIAFDEVSNEAFVGTIPFVDDAASVDRILRLLSDARIEIVLDFVDEHDRWVEILHLIAIVGNEQRARLAEILMHRNQETRTHILQTVNTFGAWDIFLSLFSVLPQAGREYFAGLLAQRPPEMQETLVRATAQESLWADLSGIVIAMPPEAGRALLAIAERVGAETGNPGLQELVRQLHEVTNRSDQADVNAS